MYLMRKLKLTKKETTNSKVNIIANCSGLKERETLSIYILRYWDEYDEFIDLFPSPWGKFSDWTKRFFAVKLKTRENK